MAVILLFALAMLLGSTVLNPLEASAQEPNIEFAKDEVLRLGESCPEGTHDVGWPLDHPRRLAICRPDGFVPLASPLGSEALCDLAVEAGVFGVWFEGHPVSVCLYGYSRPVPDTGCPAFAIESTLSDRFDGGAYHACARPVLVRGLSSPAVAGSIENSTLPVCITDDRLLDHVDAVNLEVGDIVRGEGSSDYLLTTGASCDFDCVGGFDVNCDGKLGDYCPSELNRRTVAGAQACLATFSTGEAAT